MTCNWCEVSEKDRETIYHRMKKFIRKIQNESAEKHKIKLPKNIK